MAIVAVAAPTALQTLGHETINLYCTVDMDSTFIHRCKKILKVREAEDKSAREAREKNFTTTPTLGQTASIFERSKLHSN